MSRQPDNQQRGKKSQTERYSEAKPINDRRAAILSVIGCICGLVVAWGAADNHHTTMIVAIIVGVVCFAFAGYFHWTPSKGQDENLQLVAPPALLDATHTITPTLVEVKAKTEPQPDPPPRNAPVGKRPRPSSYTEAIVFGIHWLWEYNELEPGIPRRLKAFCVECAEELLPTAAGLAATGPQTIFDCTNPLCIAFQQVITIVSDSNDAYASVRKQIIEKIKKTPVNAIPFPVGPPLWSEYTQDVFFGMIWRWHYKLEFDNDPHDVHPFCMECDRPLRLIDERQHPASQGDKKLMQWLMRFSCIVHPKQLAFAPGQSNFWEIKRLIREKIADGSWEVAVMRQKSRY